MKQRGFTLVELLAILVLITIITVIMVAHFHHARGAASTVRCLADLSSFAAEIESLAPTGPAPTQEEVRKYTNWGTKYSDYWYIPNNSDSNMGHGNDLDGCDEENPGNSLPGRDCIPMRFLIVCTHQGHGSDSDAKYCFYIDGLPPQMVPYGDLPRTFMEAGEWWDKKDPNYDKWVGWTPKK